MKKYGFNLFFLFTSNNAVIREPWKCCHISTWCYASYGSDDDNDNVSWIKLQYYKKRKCYSNFSQQVFLVWLTFWGANTCVTSQCKTGPLYNIHPLSIIQLKCPVKWQSHNSTDTATVSLPAISQSVVTVWLAWLHSQGVEPLILTRRRQVRSIWNPAEHGILFTFSFDCYSHPLK